VVIRSRLSGRTGPSGGPALTDVIGVLQSYDGVTAKVLRRDGTPVTVPVADIVAAKPVPEQPVRGLRTSAEELERICSAGWPATEIEPLGEWVLRAAGGFTGRANSALVAGDPGIGLPEALDRVVRFYAQRVLRARAQVVVGSRWEDDLSAAGWRPSRGDHRPGVVVQVAALRTALAAALAMRGQPAAAVRITDRADDAWLSRYLRARDSEIAQVRQVLEGPALVAFARVGDPTTGIGRMVVTGDWAGLSAVEVVPTQRRRGLARAVVAALAEWAVDQGARWAYLQVSTDSVPALALWHSLGFREHHRYRYLEPSSASD